VQIGRRLERHAVGRAGVIASREPYNRPAGCRPPFPSAAHYDAKAWALARDLAAEGALFWNVAGDPA
jgi:hypothetical protein